MSFYSGKKVLVSGGSGFLGRNLVGELLAQGASVRVACRRPPEPAMPGAEAISADLTDPEACRRIARGMECVFHLAAFGWGLGENVRHQPQLLTQNVLMSTALLEAAHREGVERYLYTSSSSVYPGNLTRLEEDHPWDAPPHPSELCFGWAKRLGEVQARAYHEHYGMKVAIVRPTNPYGPWDTLDRQKAHVIPALILRALARENPFTVWGTGSVERSFIYSGDVVRGMLLALEHGADADPINLASPETIRIRDLVRLVLDACGHNHAQVTFDPSKPEGHPCKVPGIRKAGEKFGFHAQVLLKEGLQITAQWFQEHRHQGTP